MQSAIVENGTVVNVIVGDIDGSIPCGEDVSIGWSYDGEAFAAPPAPEHEPPTQADYSAAIQQLIDTTPSERLFRDGVTLASYVASTNPQWAAEAQAFVAWRDQVWAYAYAELEKVLMGQRQQPTVAEILAELPPIVWPVV